MNNFFFEKHTLTNKNFNPKTQSETADVILSTIK